jgi:hypothetical protein
MIVKLCYLLVLALIVASAQETAPDGFQLWTSTSLMQMAQELKTEAARSPQHLAARKLADFQNDLFMLSHREADGIVEWHETQADVFFVQSARQRCSWVAIWSAAKPQNLTKNVMEQSRVACVTSFPRETSSAFHPRPLIKSC